MGLIDVLIRFGFDPQSRAKMVRHQDTRPGVDFAALIEADQFEQYQSWQSRRVFHDLDCVVSFIGDGGGRAKFWGVYRVQGHETVPFDALPQCVPWPWRDNEPHYRYDLQPMSGYETLQDESFVIKWSGERTWVQQLKNSDVLECPALRDIDLPAWSPLFVEGRSFARLVESRQRSREAREKCLAIHGCKCGVCGMTFPERYAGLGKGFMHVHHMRRLASQSSEYDIDPKEDLRPVCPNCHAMLHCNTDTPRSIDELRELMRE